MEKLLDRHVFCFDPSSNGGESLVLVTEIFDNGDAARGLPEDVFLNQKLELHSYCNSASLNLVGTTFGPELLRKLADELDEAIAKARASIKQEG